MRPEFKQANPDGYQYGQFCELYRQWVQKFDVFLGRESCAEQKNLFVDYAGPTNPIHIFRTGETQEAYVFEATLGTSNYTFAQAPLSQDFPS